MIENFFNCPYCGELISVVVELLDGEQTYIEDCEICCNPIQLNLTVSGREIKSFEAKISE